MAAHPLPGRIATLSVALLLAACATADGDGTPGNEVPGEPDPDPAPGAATITGVSPRSGPAGTDVRLRGTGFPPGSEIRIGFGPPQSEYDVLETVTAGPDGGVSTTVAVPSWAEGDRRYVFVLAAPADDPRAVSDAFHVTAAGGTVRVEGEVTDEGVECPAIRTPDGTIYTLAGGDTAGLQAGDRVVVEGTIAEMSICMQGITLAVSSVERR
ncbi:MAG: hypothetical protein KY453_05145 [Gemmatimonadetes bacterium]|nr:hypothetical protein [Gemmatimonadota bacterium]